MALRGHFRVPSLGASFDSQVFGFAMVECEKNASSARGESEDMTLLGPSARESAQPLEMHNIELDGLRACEDAGDDVGSKPGQWQDAADIRRIGIMSFS